MYSLVMSPQSHPDPARYDAFLQLLRTADVLWDASREFLVPWGLGPSQFNVLNLLRGVPEGLTQVELSRQLIMHRSNVTGLVDRLEKRGLLKRQAVENDRRAYRVVLTSTGEKVMLSILPHYFDAITKLWGDISERRLKDLAASLKQAANNAEVIARQTIGVRYE